MRQSPLSERSVNQDQLERRPSLGRHRQQPNHVISGMARLPRPLHSVARPGLPGERAEPHPVAEPTIHAGIGYLPRLAGIRKRGVVGRGSRPADASRCAERGEAVALVSGRPSPSEAGLRMSPRAATLALSTADRELNPHRGSPVLTCGFMPLVGVQLGVGGPTPHRTTRAESSPALLERWFIAA